jgi:hypothetical protein
LITALRVLGLEISFLTTVPFLLKAVCLPWSPYLVGLTPLGKLYNTVGTGALCKPLDMNFRENTFPEGG